MTISRRQFLSLGIASGVGLVAPIAVFGEGSSWAGYNSATVIDGLGFPGGLKTETGTPLTPVQLDDIKASGLSATHLTVGPVGTMPSVESFEGVMRALAFWDGEIERNTAVLARIRSVEDIARAKSEQRTGLIYGMQDGVAFETDLTRLDVLHRFGVRIIQPTYNRRNLLGDGCMEPANAGLSRDGRSALERMNELGIMIDLSHCGRQTAADALAVSKKPVSFTHTGCAALIEHPRHRTDSEMRAAAESGGVVGIYIMPYLAGGQQPTGNDVVRHLLHAINMAGEDHVALGTDGAISPTELTPEYRKAFRAMTKKRRELGIAAPGETDTGYLFASDLNTPQRFETLAGMLEDRGLGNRTIEKVLGSNLMRVYGDTWSV
jgi:membrane dipeptidase